MYAVLRVVLKVPGRARPGQCILCGCTEQEACEGGCYWVDSTTLLCSRCFHDAERWRRVMIGLAHVEPETPRKKKRKRKAAA